LKQLDEVTVDDCRDTHEHILLLPTRGGHWLELIERDCKPEILPPYLLALSITRQLARINAKKPLLVALRARRAKQLQDRDLQVLTRIMRLHGYNPEITMLQKTTDTIPTIPDAEADSVVPLAILPGKLVDNAANYAKQKTIPSLGPILSYATIDIASWITSIAE